jgi:LysM repeat protein
LANISIHFSKQVGNDLKKYIYLIFLILFISGCSGTLRLSTGPSGSPIPNQDSMLASTRIPDPPGNLTSDLPTDSDSAGLIQAEASLALSLETNQGHLWGNYLSIALPADENNWNWEFIPLPTVEELDLESNKDIFIEKTQSSPPLKIAKTSLKAPRHEISPIEGGAKRGEDKQSSEIFKDANQGENRSSPSIELQEADNWIQDLFGQTEGKTFLSALPTEGVMDPPSSATKQSSFSSAVSIFPSLVNEKVTTFISFFQRKADSFFSRSLARSQAYEEMMKRIFREKDLPEELFYLALIESGYNPTALSRAKASGIWQFVAQTAKRFGLRVDKWVDERRDPEKSTHAAAEYLKTLHGMFNSWDLATAGYNAGEGKVLKAMKIARSDDFWEISKYRYLKQETKKYVPMFLAAVTIAKEPQKYGFDNIEYHPPLVYEKVPVPPSTSLALIAKAAETDLAEIRSLNPALIREKTPPNSPSFDIKLPMGKKEVFERNFSNVSRPSANSGQHRVSSGETLTRVAKKYQVSIADLCAANEISPQTVLKPGAILKIPR